MGALYGGGGFSIFDFGFLIGSWKCARVFGVKVTDSQAACASARAVGDLYSSIVKFDGLLRGALVLPHRGGVWRFVCARSEGIGFRVLGLGVGGGGFAGWAVRAEGGNC